MRQFRLIMAAAVLPALIGCTSSTAEVGKGTKPADFHGSVDTALRPEQQAKQRVLRDVMMNLYDGFPPEKIANVLHGVRFQESSRDFLDGAVRLAAAIVDGVLGGR